MIREWKREKHVKSKFIKNQISFIFLILFALLVCYFVDEDRFSSYFILACVIIVVGIIRMIFYEYIVKIQIDLAEKYVTVQRTNFLFNGKKEKKYNLNGMKSTYAKERISRNRDGGMTLRVYKNNELIIKIHEVEVGWKKEQLLEIHDAISSLLSARIR